MFFLPSLRAGTARSLRAVPRCHYLSLAPAHTKDSLCAVSSLLCRVVRTPKSHSHFRAGRAQAKASSDGCMPARVKQCEPFTTLNPSMCTLHAARGVSTTVLVDLALAMQELYPYLISYLDRAHTRASTRLGRPGTRLSQHGTRTVPVCEVPKMGKPPSWHADLCQDARPLSQHGRG